VRPDTAIRDVATQAARKFQLLQDDLEACRFCWCCSREEAVTSMKNLHEVGIHSYCEIHMLMRLREGMASRRKPRERVEFNQEPCHIRRGLHLLHPPTCRCGNFLQCVEGKTEVIRGFGPNASGAELIATRDIARGDVVAVFCKTATLWTSMDVHEFQALVDATNNDPCGCYCKCYNYRRNGNMAVPGLFISSGAKQGGNCLEWQSR